MAAVTICSDFGDQEKKICQCFQISSIYLPWSGGTECHSWFFECCVSSQLFQSSLSHSSRGSLVPLRVPLLEWSHLHIWGVVPEILISPYYSSSPEFHMMYSAYKLNKKGDNIQPCHTSFPILNQYIVPCSVLTIASWPAYRFLRRQVRWSGIPISFKNLSQFV